MPFEAKGLKYVLDPSLSRPGSQVFRQQLDRSTVFDPRLEAAFNAFWTNATQSVAGPASSTSSPSVSLQPPPQLVKH